MKPDVSPTLLEAELRRSLGEISELTPMVEGEESRVFGFRRDAEDLVVRINPSIEGFRKDALVYRHFATAELPAPAVVSIGILDDGHAYCVSRRIAGVTLQALSRSRLQPLLEPVALVMDAIAASDVTTTSGFGSFDASGVGKYPSWRDFLTSVADRDRYDWLAASKHADMTRVGRFLGLIGDLAGNCPEVRRLVHGDFGSNNVLTDGSRVTAVIDWSEALLGDPLYDVANILFWRSWLDCMEQQARYFEAQRPELLHDADRLRCYQLRIGVEEIYQSAIAGDARLVPWAMARCDQIADSSGG
jgi:hygromycin-B 4-O-kinase